MPIDITENLLMDWNKKNIPPLPDVDIIKVIKSAYHQTEHPPKKNSLGDYITSVKPSVKESLMPTPNSKISLNTIETNYKSPKLDSKESLNSVNGGHKSEVIKDFIIETGGSWFGYIDLDRELGIVNANDKVLRRVLINTLLTEKIIEKHPSKVHTFRFINKEAEVISIKPLSEVTKVDLWLPFNLNRLVNIYASNICCVVGDPNAGKTSTLLNVAIMNRDKFKVNYFSSEMYEDELSLRVAGFDDIPLGEWNKIQFKHRSIQFADVVEAGDLIINIVDYMEITDNFYLIGQYISEIYNRHGRSVTFIGLQKKRGAELGRGAEFSLEKPRLYLSLSPGRVKIIKGKNWKHKTVNPNDLECTYKLIGGAKIVDVSEWHEPNGAPVEIPEEEGNDITI
jgi:hypothetical protein